MAPYNSLPRRWLRHFLKRRRDARFWGVPTFVPTSDLFHCFEDVRIAGVNVALRGVHVRMTRQHVKSERVHVLRPSRDACVPECVQDERRHARCFLRCRVLLLETGGFDMLALGRSRENPLGNRAGARRASTE